MYVDSVCDSLIYAAIDTKDRYISIRQGAPHSRMIYPMASLSAHTCIVRRPLPEAHWLAHLCRPCYVCIERSGLEFTPHRT